ncbi:MAG: hypothetical protein H0X43_02195 [Nitrosospira sp.]|nr:hypothetical protein [Nitrosospira sp.]
MEKILEVIEVELAVLESFPPKLRITAAGTVRTGGWSNPRLEPYVHIQAPPDGIHDFDFVADRPEGIVTQVISPIAAVYTWENFPEGVKGVRVHASENSKTAWLKTGMPDRQPNRFTFSECNGTTRIEFFPKSLTPLGTSGSSADAQLEYHGAEGQLMFRGEDITQEQTVLGSLISVTLQPNADAGGVDFALVLPPVNLAGQARQRFETVGIKMRSRGRVIDSAGAELSYEVLLLNGVAEDIPVL